MRLVVAVEKELAQLNQREVDAEVTGDDDNEIGEGADREMNENAVVCCYLRVTATPIVFAINRAKCALLHLRFVRVRMPRYRLDKSRVTNIADCYASKARETQECKNMSLLHETRRGSDHTQDTQAWSDQRLTPVMQQ